MTILLLACLCLGFVKAQNTKSTSSATTYGFEEDNRWITRDSALWATSGEQAAGGTKSLKYGITGGILPGEEGLLSIETGYTIQKVRVAGGGDNNYIVASSYEGTVLGIGYDGAIMWKNSLSGFMVHDMWCADLTGDGVDEIVVANADGAAYCLDPKGKIMWKFHPGEVPMYAVCIVEKNSTPYVVCGGFDLNIYYLSATGKKIKEIRSSTYSEEDTWGIDNKYDGLHYANFLRPVPRPDGTQMLVLHGSSNHMQVNGSLYFFEVLEERPFKIKKVDSPDNIGDFRISDVNGDGNFEILLGVSCHQNSAGFVRYNLGPENSTDEMEVYPTSGLGFGYVVTQPVLITDVDTRKYMQLVGNRIILISTDLAPGFEKQQCNYSFNDMWQDGDRIVLASAQSGGSCVHILDTRNPGWKKAYREIEPQGKLEKIIDNHAAYRSALASYTRPEGEREPRPVYLMTESTDEGLAKQVADHIRANYDSPIFLGGGWTNKAEDWDRSAMPNEKYRDRRDRRRQYTYTQQQCIDMFTPWYDGEPGIAFWGGHGNDPYMFQLETHVKTLDHANGKKTVLIYPELEDHSDDFAWVMEDLFYPLADSCRSRNANIYVRTKHNFWQGNIYLPMWEKTMDGHYADIFVPSMEETTDKAMDISVSGRTGVWASGAVNDWGTRTVPDNPSFDRSRQFSHMRIPSHFLRHMVYHMANGATYINNFAVNPDYMSFAWELIAKGALYVPRSDEILSLSPVHLGMKEPDEHYMVEGSSLKWSVYYDKHFEENNPFVFSRQNATWMAAQVTDWDFSAYASGAKDRRQNYLPPYPEGLVLITPPQEGVFAKTGVPRGALKDHLHPIYSDIMTEFITDGRHYYSADGSQTYAADVYADTISQAIRAGAEKLPLTVSGEVAWVVAQTAPDNLRLTIIDGGYLNPDDREAAITFHSVTPVSMKDIVDGKVFDISDPSAVSVDVPCGLFRFIDIGLSEPL